MLSPPAALVLRFVRLFPPPRQVRDAQITAPELPTWARDTRERGLPDIWAGLPCVVCRSARGLPVVCPGRPWAALGAGGVIEVNSFVFIKFY